MRRPPCPPCDRWTPMRAVERRRALSPFPACGNSRRRPSARVENPLVRCLPAPDRRMFHGNGPRDAEPRANRGENSLVARYTVGMENIVYGTERFGCMLEQPPASPIPREFRASSGQRPYLEPSRESSPRMHASPVRAKDTMAIVRLSGMSRIIRGISRTLASPRVASSRRINILAILVEGQFTSLWRRDIPR